MTNVTSGNITYGFRRMKKMKNKKVLIGIIALIVIVLAVLWLTGVFGGKKAEKISIALPNDATNEGRALLLLQAQGLIKLKDDAGITATVADITENKLGITFNEVEAAMVPNVLKDADYGIINGNYALAANLPATLLYENAESPYVNVDRKSVV